MNNARYIIKVIAKAKNNNLNFAGKINIYWYGKRQMLLANDLQAPTVEIETLTNYCIEHYGYKRMYDAIRAAKFWNKCNENPENCWSYSTEVILKEF